MTEPDGFGEQIFKVACCFTALIIIKTIFETIGVFNFDNILNHKIFRDYLLPYMDMVFVISCEEKCSEKFYVMVQLILMKKRILPAVWFINLSLTRLV